MTTTQEADLVDSHEAAKIAGISLRTMYNCRAKEAVPEPIIGGGRGRHMLWARADIEEWAKTRRTRKRSQ